MTDFGLKSGELAAISAVLKNYPAIERAVIFGSRAKGCHRPYSDVDIALYGGMDLLEVESVICDLDELPLVYKFDAVAYETLKNPALRQHIDRVGVTFYTRTP
jgi:predicted nucleotidyltransferase